MQTNDPTVKSPRHAGERPPVERASSALWRPFADMTVGNVEVLEITRGEGVWLWDASGNRYLDGSSSLWYANVGHGRVEIAEAIRKQLAQLEPFTPSASSRTGPAEQLADRLAGLSPSADSKVFLVSGGGDAFETAVKLARLFHVVRGEPARRFVISRTDAYHGTHGIGTSIMGMPYTEGFGPLVEETIRVPWDSADALEAEIERLGASRVAAFVFEPVIASGGVRVPPDGYLERICDVCRRHGVLTIADAVVNAFGRLGTWLGVERWNLQPDMVVFAKGVTSGYLPLGGVVVAPAVAAPFFEEGGATFTHGITYSGHATCCAAALANLDLLAANDLVFRAREVERPFHARLAGLETPSTSSKRCAAVSV